METSKNCMLKGDRPVGGIRSSARICPCFKDSVDRVRPAELVSWSNTLLLL